MPQVSPNSFGSLTIQGDSPENVEEQDQEKEKTKKLVMDLFDKAKKHRSKYDDKWLDYYKMFRGKQWKELRPSYKHSEVINMVFQHIQAVVPILTDSRPRLQFLPTEPSDRPFSEIIDKVVDYEWTRYNALQSLTEMVYDGHFYGTGISYVGYDLKADHGVGATEYCSADPFYCYPDPDATGINKDCKYFIYAEPKSLDDLKREYPKFAKQMKSDIIDWSELDRTNMGDIKYKTPSTSVSFVSQSSSDATRFDQALKIECYITAEMSEIINEETTKEDGTVEQISRRKYPKGRKICIAGGVVVSDIENPYDDGLIPYAKFSNYLLPREFWGVSEIEPLEGPQKIFNKLVCFALDVLTLMGNPIYIIDTSSGIDTEELFNRPGLVIEKEPGSEVRREEGVGLQPYVLQLIDRMRGWFNELGGSQDITRGVQPTGITAGTAIDALQEAAQTRIRQKSRNLDAYLQEVGRLWFSRIMQFYTVPKVIRITNDQNAEQYFKFHIENVDNPDGTQKKIANIRQIHVTDQGPVEGELHQHEIQGEFDVKISTGTTLPFARSEKFTKALSLFKEGLIDQEEVLKVADWPNWEAVLDRMNKNKEMLAQQQAQQGAPQ